MRSTHGGCVGGVPQARSRVLVSLNSAATEEMTHKYENLVLRKTVVVASAEIGKAQ